MTRGAKQSRRAGCVKALAWGVLVLALLFCFLVCQERQNFGPNVRIIVPNGFRGWIFFIEDRDALPVPLENGEYVIRVPMCGSLRVHDLDFETKWHTNYAQFESGTAISELDPAPDEVATRGGAMQVDTSPEGKPRTMIIQFIGTEAEYLKALGTNTDPVEPSLPKKEEVGPIRRTGGRVGEWVKGRNGERVSR